MCAGLDGMQRSSDIWVRASVRIPLVCMCGSCGDEHPHLARVVVKIGREQVGSPWLLL